MSAPRATSVLWHQPSRLLGLSCVLLPVGVAFSTCLVGLPIAARALKGLAALVVTNAQVLRGREATTDSEQSYAGSIGLLLLFGFLSVPMLVGLVAADLVHEAGAGLGVAAAIGGGAVAAVGLGVALAMILLAPVVAVAGVRGFFAPFGRAVELAAARGPGASLALGARVGGLYAVWYAALAAAGLLLEAEGGARAGLLLGCFGAVLATPRALAILANAWADVDDAAARVGATDGQLRGLAWMILPALAVLSVAFVVAATVPIPMRRGEAPAPQQRGFHPEALGGYVRAGRLPGTSVWVRVLERGIAIEAEDGGGAGELAVDFDTRDAWLVVEQRARDGAPVPEFRVAVSNGERWASTVVDADGVRLDDSLVDRTFGRLGRVGSAGLAIAALLLLFLTFTVGVELGEAQRLHAPALLDGERRSGGLAALEGTLRLGAESRVFYAPPGRWALLFGRGARLRAEGEAWIEAADGAIRFRLPDTPVEVIGGATPDDWSGVHVVLLSRFPSVGIAGPRQAAASWPDDGRVALGGRGDAQRALMQRAVRRASRVALPMLVGVGVAVLALLLGL